MYELKLRFLSLAHRWASRVHEPPEIVRRYLGERAFFCKKAHSSWILIGVHRAQNIKNFEKQMLYLIDGFHVDLDPPGPIWK